MDIGALQPAHKWNIHPLKAAASKGCMVAITIPPEEAANQSTQHSYCTNHHIIPTPLQIGANNSTIFAEANYKQAVCYQRPPYSWSASTRLVDDYAHGAAQALNSCRPRKPLGLATARVCVGQYVKSFKRGGVQLRTARTPWTDLS